MQLLTYHQEIHSRLPHPDKKHDSTRKQTGPPEASSLLNGT